MTRWPLTFAIFALVTTSGLIAFAQTEIKTETVNQQASEISLDFLDLGETPTLEQLEAMQEKVREVSDLVKKATVNIQIGGAQGTGVIISRDGYIFTAAHVIGKPDINANIRFPDSSVEIAKTLGMNRSMDSGMLKLEGDGPYPYIDIGESSDLVKGQWIMAVGHPGGWNEKRGMVTRVGRVLSTTSKFLRTDCVLVGGDSGGPLVDMNGNLIGIHSRISRNLWENMHVPVDSFSDEWDELVDGKIVGERPMPYVGISFKDSTNEVSKVVENSPADEAGIETGDLIVGVDDTEIENRSDFSQIARKFKPEDRVSIKVQREDEELDLELVVGTR